MLLVVYQENASGITLAESAFYSIRGEYASGSILKECDPSIHIKPLLMETNIT